MADAGLETMRFDIYGRYQLEIVRENERWVIYRLDFAKRHLFSDFAIPASLRPDEVQVYLDDMLHELARPETEIRRID